MFLINKRFWDAVAGQDLHFLYARRVVLCYGLHCLSIRPSVRPLAISCPEHNSLTIRHTNLKLYRCIDLIVGVCRAQEPLL